MNLKIPKRVRNHVNPLSILHKNKIQKFPEKKPVIIDIGSYRGEFVEKWNQKFPGKYNFIVFEIRVKFFEYLKEKFKEQKNIQVFDGDAAKSLKEMILDLRKDGIFVEKIFINFPDPWFKKKHHKRRLLKKDFLDELMDVLDEKTEIIFQTDQKKLFIETREIIHDHKDFFGKRFFQPIKGIRTYWENMKIKEGDKIYRLKIWFKPENKKIHHKIIDWIKR